MPIRWRLTLWFAVVLLVILAGGSFFLNTLLGNYLLTSIDDNLAAYSQRLHNESGRPDYNDIKDSLPDVNDFASPGIYIQFVDNNGRIIAKSDNLGDQQLPVNPTLLAQGFRGNPATDSVSGAAGSRLRIMVTPFYLADDSLVLEVAQSLDVVDATLRRLRAALTGGVLIALGVVGISGAILVRRALLPVEKVTATAEDIEASSDLTRRVNYAGANDEIARLATTFDRMLDRLDDAFASQRNFVADASHELRGPLTVIRGNLDLMRRNLSEADRAESLRAIRAESDRMAEIVNDLLQLAELESGRIEHEEISLSDIFENVLKRGRQGAGTRQIVVERSEEIVLRGDAYRLDQLLWNLLGNAIRYTPENGTITMSLYRNDGYACLEVRDTGIGIPEDHLPHIFDRFYRVDKARSRARGGTGLGLAIVKNIAEQHGGRVTVTSLPGVGSGFVAWLKI